MACSHSGMIKGEYMKFYYVNSAGKRINFYEYPYLFQDGNILDYSWKYDNDNLKISNVHKEPGERSFRLALLPDVQLALPQRKRLLQQAANKVFEVFEYDVCNSAYGRLYSEAGYYLPCMIVSSNKSDWQNGVPYMFQEFQLITQMDFWLKETKYSYFPVLSAEKKALSFPYDFPFDLARSLVGKAYINTDNFLPSDFVLTIYGSVLNPNISIGGNSYGLNCEIKKDERVVISLLNGKKEIKCIDKFGNVKNYFEYRNKKNSVFAPIKSGINSIVWNGDFGFDLVIVDRRSEPKWAVPDDSGDVTVVEETEEQQQGVEEAVWIL